MAGTTKTTDPGDLTPHPYNARLYRQRTPSRRFIEDVAEKMEEPLVINDQGEIIDGVRRWLAVSELGWDKIEVIERSYPSVETEKKAILRHNDDRDETFSQKIRVAMEYEKLVAPLLEKRMKAGKSLDEQEADPLLKSDEGATAIELAGDRVGWGKDKYWQAKTVWDAKESGDNYARKLVARLDDGEISVNKAYEELNENRGKAGREEIPDDQRGILLSEGVPVEKIEANINNPEQAALVLHSTEFKRLLKQVRLPRELGGSNNKFVRLEMTKEGLNIETVAEIESDTEPEELRGKYVIPPNFFDQFNATNTPVSISLLVNDLLSYLDLWRKAHIRVQFHGEPDNRMASSLYITPEVGPIIYLQSPTKWTDDHSELPNWIPENQAAP